MATAICCRRRIWWPGNSSSSVVVSLVRCAICKDCANGLSLRARLLCTARLWWRMLFVSILTIDRNDQVSQMSAMISEVPVLVAGGGIGGLAAALALARRGFPVKVLEQAQELGETGAGIQLGPNAFAAFDALGVGPSARASAVYADELVMHDAVDESVVGRLALGEAFRKRFGNPYAVIHRVDIHRALLDGARANGHIELLTSTRVERV